MSIAFLETVCSAVDLFQRGVSAVTFCKCNSTIGFNEKKKRVSFSVLHGSSHLAAPFKCVSSIGEKVASVHRKMARNGSRNAENLQISFEVGWNV